MDLDGFSTAKKSLSVTASMTDGVIQNDLYAYLLGPYEFGGSTTGTIFTNSGQPLAITVEFKVFPKRTCLNHCN